MSWRQRYFSPYRMPGEVEFEKPDHAAVNKQQFGFKLLCWGSAALLYSLVLGWVFHGATFAVVASLTSLFMVVTAVPLLILGTVEKHKVERIKEERIKEEDERRKKRSNSDE